MRRFAMLLVVVAILAFVSACDALGADLKRDLDALAEEWNPEDYGLLTLYIEREGQEAGGTAPIYWLVSGWAYVPIGLDHTSGEGNGLIYGTGRGVASWTFEGGGCSGVGTWPVQFEVTGFFDGHPKCSVSLMASEKWLGGSASTMDCGALGGGTTINESLGYSFGGMDFNASNIFTVHANTAGTPTPGAAGDQFHQWSWSGQITRITVPDWVGCNIDIGVESRR